MTIDKSCVWNVRRIRIRESQSVVENCLHNVCAPIQRRISRNRVRTNTRWRFLIDFNLFGKMQILLRKKRPHGNGTEIEKILSRAEEEEEERWKNSVFDFANAID